MSTQPHDHTTTDRLWNLAMGAPDPDMEAHLASCAECQAELATLRALAGYRVTTGGSMAEPPAAVQVMATALFRQVRPDLLATQPSLADRATNALQRLAANLVLDTGTAALAGVRSDGSRQTRQLAFVSDLGDLDLTVTARDAASEVHGQLGLDDLPAQAVIHFSPATPDAAIEPVDADLSENGRFAVSLPHGEWLAWVRIGDAILEFPGIRL